MHKAMQKVQEKDLNEKKAMEYTEQYLLDRNTPHSYTYD